MMPGFKPSLGKISWFGAIAATVVALPAIAESVPGSAVSPTLPTAQTPVAPTKPTAPMAPAKPMPQMPSVSIPDAPLPTLTTPSVTSPTLPVKPALPIAPTSEAATPKAASGTIVDVAASNQSFTTLVKAVKAAGLVETLSGKGPFTVFAPTDAAFAALPPGTVEALLKPENKEKLKQLLTYHVVPGAVVSTALKPGEVTTVQGKPVTVMLMGKKVMVNNANVTTADVKASNGVIHIVDQVILPPGF